MNCEECKDQIFELIEREAVDPEGVRAILERCPDCRAEFESTKKALAAAAALPIEQPPAVLDRAILRAAQEKAAPNVVPLRRRLLQPPPWAMAAVALLAVGIGVWSIPRTVEFEEDSGSVATEPREMKDMKETAKLEDAVAEAPAVEPSAAPDDDAAQGLRAEAAQDREAPVERGASTKGANRAPPRKAYRAKRSRTTATKPATIEADQAEAEEAAPPAAAPSIMAQEAQVAARRAADESVDARDDAYAAKAKAAPAVGGAAMEAAAAGDAEPEATQKAACRSRLSAFETRLRKEKRYEPSPEEELAVGRCYQTLGDAKNARTWLERAAKHRATRKRANEALQRLGPQ